MSHPVALRSTLNSALHLVEIEAAERAPGTADHGQLRVLASFIYSWGDAMISRDEAMLRLNQMERA